MGPLRGGVAILPTVSLPLIRWTRRSALWSTLLPCVPPASGMDDAAYRFTTIVSTHAVGHHLSCDNVPTTFRFCLLHQSLGSNHGVTGWGCYTKGNGV